uniref:NADH dehydrogenase [ubiquinone] 1 beta subcomplex subunit 3 n=1 Tax=Elaeophora elaphi TaxID=1147741 RepID=A0A0R3S172_9BILA
MGHDHEPKIPSYTLYDNYREIPKLRAHEERLARIGLKDPWIRNHAYLFMGRFAGDQWGSFKHMIRAGWKLGCGVAAAVIAVEESYMYLKYGHTHWGKEHH